MIKKLERCIREEDGIKISCPPDNVHIINKINELIDELNHILEEREHVIKVYEEVMPNMKPADPYAEQRKWMWHLCRFWFDNKKQADVGILGEIEEDNCHPYFNLDLGHHYKHCEPVKPDDDLIYKGE